MKNFLLISLMPIFFARSISPSFLGLRRPCISPPTQRSAAAAKTPSGAPPMPIKRSIPVSRFVARTIKNDDRQILDLALLRFGERVEVLCRCIVEIDDAFSIRADGNFVHIGVRTVKKVSMLRHGDNGQGVGRAISADRRSL